MTQEITISAIMPAPNENVRFDSLGILNYDSKPSDDTLRTDISGIIVRQARTEERSNVAVDLSCFPDQYANITFLASVARALELESWGEAGASVTYSKAAERKVVFRK